jgi:hypothetical protein
MKSVYEADNIVEAQMILDLLERSGIEGQIRGEYLQGGAGELGVGGLVSVQAHENDASRAKGLIAEWESKQIPVQDRTMPTKRSFSGFWGFIAGVVTASIVLAWVFATPFETLEVDLDRDGVADEYYFYKGEFITRVETDRNRDGKVDIKSYYGARGLLAEDHLDDDFDGRYETVIAYENGNPISYSADRDGDNHTELTGSYTHGVFSRMEYVPVGRRQPKLVEMYKDGILDEQVIDSTGDGDIDTRIIFDNYGLEIDREDVGNDSP